MPKVTKFLLFYHKSLQLAQYVREYSSLQSLSLDPSYQISYHSLPQQNRSNGFATLPSSLRRLLFFALPDLVICIDDGISPIRPIFAFELTEAVPASDHWMQRFVHLVGCAQEKVPATFIMPFSLPNHPKFKGKEDPPFFFAYDRVMEIHQTPLYIANWEAANGRSPDPDPKYGANVPAHTLPDIQKALAFLDLVIDAAIHGRDFSNLMKERMIVNLRNQVRNIGYKRIPEIRDFNRLLFGKFLSLVEVDTWLKGMGKGLALPTSLPDRITKREKCIIFRPQVKPTRKRASKAGSTDSEYRAALLKRITQKGGDPYTGMPLAFDYLFCRLGTTPYERDANLIIDLSVLSFSDLAQYHHDVWKQSPLQYKKFSQIKHIPTYTMYLKEGSAQVIKNFLRVYAFTADLIVFADGIIYF